MKETEALGIDILGIGEKFRQRNWNTVNWEEQIKKLDIGIEVKVIYYQDPGNQILKNNSSQLSKQKQIHLWYTRAKVPMRSCPCW